MDFKSRIRQTIAAALLTMLTTCTTNVEQFHQLGQWQDSYKQCRQHTCKHGRYQIIVQ